MNATLHRDIQEALLDIPKFDVHTHLAGGRLGARGLHDLLLYHMVISDLYAAGCPSGARLTQFPDWPDREEAHGRIREAVPFLPRIRNTSCYDMLRRILADLYDWREPVTVDNWIRLDALVRERADDRAWHHEIFDRLSIVRTCAEYARRGDGTDDQRLQYSIEWAFFTRCQWGEYDTACYELERCWGRAPEPPSPIGGTRPPADRTIRTLDDVHAVIDHYVGTIPYADLISIATGFSTDIDYRVVSDDEMSAALQRRSAAGVWERDTYASYINECFLTALEVHGDQIVLQFSLGAEPLPYETGSLLYQRTLKQLADMLARHPRLRFQCFLSSRHANQTLCTLARGLPNLSLAGYWWHNFFPDAIRQVMGERLDMLPVNKQIGFFSDAYCVEWVYGKWTAVSQQLARVLTRKIQSGQYTRDEALSIAHSILYQSPQTLLGMTPFSHGSLSGTKHESR